jgi:glycosyltransferase involved in cell wall biosynthesis
VRVVLDSTHIGAVGGGENYLMRLAEALSVVSDFYITRNFNSKFEEYNGFGSHFREYTGLWKPDVYIYASHFAPHYPIGKRNFAVCFFPKKELLPRGYDGIISICDYSSRWASTYWKPKSTFTLYPCIDASLYYDNRPKAKQIISIGHFFQETDGHSKNQHILVQALTPRLIEEGFELVLVGNSNPGDEPYIRKIRKFAEGKPVRIEVNKDNDFLKTELSRSTHLWHANGYERHDPAQTEHFGIIVLEALASGVLPIVHDSGGAREITGLTWSELADLERLTLERIGVPALPEKYTVRFFNKEVERWLNSVSI